MQLKTDNDLISTGGSNKNILVTLGEDHSSWCSSSFHHQVFYWLERVRITSMNKSDVKRRNTLICLDHYMCRRFRLWNSRDHEAVKVVEDTFTAFEMQTWLPDFIMGINPFGVFCAWPFWAEEIGYLGNNTLISSLSIDRQLYTQITA